MALTAELNTPARGIVEQIALPMKAATKIYKGDLVVLADGFAIPAAVDEDLLAVGRAHATVDNAGADGALSITVDQGVFFWNGDSSFSSSPPDIAAAVYIGGDGLVSTTSTNNSKAGVVEGLEGAGAWVRSSLTLSTLL